MWKRERVVPKATVELLLRAPDRHGTPLVLLLRRAPTEQDQGGWGLPSAMSRPDETSAGTASRLAARAGADPGQVRIRGERLDLAAPAASTLIADVPEPFALPSGHATAWGLEPDVAAFELDRAFAARWPTLQAREIGLLVDAANVVGSRPDGWWRDRAGAAERLLRDVAAAVPGIFAVPEAGFRWISRPVVVLEGVAKRALDVPGPEVVRACGSGDDTIVDVARRGGEWVVVTADRGLRSRLPSGVHAVGPSTLRSWLSPQRGVSR
ncbi:MAG: NTP pyrophosphohydrolase [Actinobacteria bacterium]|nr:NTP pyrophosphohydrolase [Actinomycetota bacterium]